MVDERIVAFNTLGQGLLAELEQITQDKTLRPEDFLQVAFIFVRNAVQEGAENCNELARDFAAALRKAFPEQEKCASVALQLSALCGEDETSLKHQLSELAAKRPIYQIT